MRVFTIEVRESGAICCLKVRIGEPFGRSQERKLDPVLPSYAFAIRCNHVSQVHILQPGCDCLNLQSATDDELCVLDKKCKQ